MSNLQMTAAVEEWLDNTVLLGVGDGEFAELDRIFHELLDLGVPRDLVRDLEDATSGYAVCLSEASFLAGIELAKNPIGYLVYGKPWVGPDLAISAGTPEEKHSDELHLDILPIPSQPAQA